MFPTIHDLLIGLHAAPAQWVLALTGGGASVAGYLLSVPGSSRSLLEIVVPYHEQALAEFLGRGPDSYCSASTSQAMARRALERALWLAPEGPVYGLGCTASLISDRPKRGEHRVHVSSAGREQLRTWSLILEKGARDRAGEEGVVAMLILHAMARTLGLSGLPSVPLLPAEKIGEEVGPDGLGGPCLERVGAILIAQDGQLFPDASWNPAEPSVLLPGAFHPLHAGHLELAALAERLEGKSAAFELSVANMDKPELTPEEVRRRLGQFVGRGVVWLTRAPRFVDKARLFPGATFALGADTAARLVASRYYENGGQGLRQALDFFGRQACHFLVAGRVDSAGRYLSLNDIPIPVEYAYLFRAIPAEEFRMDVSSTSLRERCP